LHIVSRIEKEDGMSGFAEVLKVDGKRITVLGVVAIILGVLAMLMPVLAGASVVLFLGVLVLAAGIVRMIWAFGSDSVGKGMLKFAVGVLTLLCGIVLLAHPLFASVVLTLVLAIYFVVDGIVEIVAGIKRRPGLGWMWMLVGGIVSILLGVIIWRQFPLSGIWAIGILLGIKLFFVGLIMIMAGSAIRAVSKA
jgi:uncharacterized membrane protein HdeD (DUF308 family)